MELSIVTTLYRSAPYVEEFYQRASLAAQSVTEHYEIVFVNDGSPDNSLELAVQLYQKDSRVKVVDLARNFGHHCAIIAGLNQSKGEKIFLIDVDLEEDPEWLLEFCDVMQESGADVVFGIQQERGGGFFNKVFVGLFYKFFNLLSDTKIPINPCTVRLMNRNYLKSLISLKDKNLFLAGNCAWVGFDQIAINVRKTFRKERSSYNLASMFKLLLNAIACFSAYPLYLIFIMGFFIAAFSGIFGFSVLVRKILSTEAFQLGWPSVMASIWFLGGLVIFSVGTVGLYLSKVFNETKDRPLFVVKRIYGAN